MRLPFLIGRPPRPLALARHPAEMLASRPEITPELVDDWAKSLSRRMAEVEIVRADDPRLPRDLGDRPLVAPDARLLPPLDEAVFDACLASGQFRKLCAKLGMEPNPGSEALARAAAAGGIPAEGAEAAFLVRCLLRKFSAEHRWRYPIVRGDPTNRPGDRLRSDAYTLLNPHPSAPIGGVALGEAKRFGNMIAQLVNLFAMAERLGLDTVHLPEPHPLLNPPASAPIRIATGTPQAPNTLTGTFFRRAALLSRMTADDAERILARHIRPLTNPQFEALRPSPADLTIHLRSGDVFNRRNVPANYAQPPLAYYLKVIEVARPRRVRIVYEDRGNPVAKELPGRLRDMGLEVEAQSSDLVSDIAAIFHAEKLVVSRGTFGWAIADLSPHVREIFAFGTDHSRRGTLPDAQVRSFTDTEGSYIRELLSGNWRRTRAQKAMMIDYPMDAIAEIAA